jgi:hypothetical protein
MGVKDLLPYAPFEMKTTTMDEAGNPFDFQMLFTEYHRQLINLNQNDQILVPQHCSYRLIRRLIVLLPEGNFDELKLSKKIWQLASVESLPILFLALVQDQNNVAYIHRRLVTLAALTSFGKINITVVVRIGKSWIEFVKQTLLSGDLLLCLRHQTVPCFLGNRSIGEYLSHSIDAPIYLIGELRIEPSPYRFRWFIGSTSWLAIFLIIIAFGVTQVWISRTSLNPASSLLLCLLDISEFIIILGINNLMGVPYVYE